MSKLKLILIGAGGHARSCIDVIESDAQFLIAGLVGLPDEKGAKRFGYEVVASDSELSKLAQEYSHAIVAIGQILTAEHRVRLYFQAQELGFQLPSIVSPTAYVSPNASVGAGTIVMHGAVINSGARIGNNCIINTGAIIEHDAIVEDHCHISTGAILNGDVIVAAKSFIGSGSVVKEGVSIGTQSLIGMGLSVRQNLAENTRYTGGPK